MVEQETIATETGAPPNDMQETAEATVDGATLPDYLTLKAQVEEFLDLTLDARILSERCRDYKDGKQWTEAQIKELKRRKQAPVVNNRIKTKHNGLLGLMSASKSDPKAFPRNQEQDDGASEACTDGLRYVAQQQHLQSTFMAVDDNFFCEGYGGVHVCVEQNPKGEWDVTVDHIPWDRIFYDPYSRKNNFKDCRNKGYMMWMDEQDIMDAFPDAPSAVYQISQEIEMGSGDTFEDKPTWTTTRGRRKRHLVATHYFKFKGKWMLAIYTGSGFLLEPMESPYNDEYGQPDCPIELVSAYMDRQNNRYGELAGFLDLQDEINHRRSKMLFLLSQRQTFGNRGAVKDIKKAKIELAKPDGHLEVGQGEFGKDFGILPTGDMAKGQFELLQEAKGEIDSQSYNAQLSGQRQKGDLSGLAIGKLQQAGITELNLLFDTLTNFRLRVYRQMWNRIRQYWDAERWVRVTDDQTSPRWVGFNVEVKLGDYLQEIMSDDSKPYAMRIGAAAQLTQLEQQAAQAQQQGQPSPLDQVVHVKNKAAELDMDIILDEANANVNASQEQLDAILKFGAQAQFDIIDLLEISNIAGKKQLIEKIEARRKEQAESQQQNPANQMVAAKTAEMAAGVDAKKADTAKTAAQTQQIGAETAVLLHEAIHGVPFKGSVTN